jgi:hypothetical protein
VVAQTILVVEDEAKIRSLLGRSPVAAVADAP